MTTVIILVLIILGLVLILLELFVTPGFITGLLGAVAWIYALYRIYTDYGNTSGNLALAGLILLLLAFIFIGVKSGIWDKVSLHQKVEGRVNQQPELLAGDSGYALSAFRPFGIAMINETRVEASSMGELIESGSRIEVIRVEKNKIIVKQISA